MKNLIFDLGGVIIPLDLSLVNQTLSQFSAGGRQVDFHAPLFIKYELGNISSATFRQGVRDFVGLPALSDAQIDEAWNSLLLPIPIERIQLLQKLSKQYRIFLLSNTNEIHLERVHQILHEVSGIACLDDLFEKAYYSHLLHLRKPHKEIYEAVLADAGLLASETVFIDDNQANAEGASAVGMQGIWLDLSKNTILEVDFTYK